MAEAVNHMRQVNQELAAVSALRKDELYDVAKEMGVSYELLVQVHEAGRSAGG